LAEAIRETQASLWRFVPDIARRNTTDLVVRGIASLARAHTRGDKFVCGIWDRPAGTYLGEVGLYAIDRTTDTAEMGYWLRESARGQGYALEAVRLLAKQAFDDLGMRQIEAHIGQENTASRRVAERAGFELTGYRLAILPSDPTTGTMLIYKLGAIGLNQPSGAADDK
jgi:RimJ/RimL family protein N-acetyltransferase